MWGKAFIMLVVIPGAVVGAGWVMLRARGHSSLGSIRAKRAAAIESRKIQNEIENLVRGERIFIKDGGDVDWYVLSVDARRKRVHIYDPISGATDDVDFGSIIEIV